MRRAGRHGKEKKIRKMPEAASHLQVGSMDGRIALFDLVTNSENAIATFDISGVAEPIHAVRFSPGLGTRWLAVANVSAISMYRLPWKYIRGKGDAERTMHDLLHASDALRGP
jgi:hypothetical protein